jgi:hypothetical protein
MAKNEKSVSSNSRVTWDGRLTVDVNKLYRSKQVQDTLRNLGKNPQAPVCTPSPNPPQENK